MATDLNLQVAGIKDDYKYGFRDSDDHYAFKSGKGLSRAVVNQISEMKNEPAWMRDFRLKALEAFHQKPTPTWGGELSELNFDDIHYYMKAADRQGKSWDDVPAEIKNTFDKLGIPEAERKFLAGVGAQYESEAVYHSLRKEWEKQGVIFTDSDSGLREHEDIYREYFGTVIPPTDNFTAALNSAVWSGGSFVYVPKGVNLDIPLQAYFRINAQSMGQFERTMIIVDEGASVHYVEGCTAPVYAKDSFHSGVIEILVRKGGRCRYTTIQNWST
ncbi:MAG: Fe-S cluster assembly protein SufB, partial [Isosphaeraceae bacterium]